MSAESMACPRCGGYSVRLHLAHKSVLEDAKTIVKLAEFKKSNPVAAGFAMGASGSMLLADRLGLLKIYLCPSCNHPFSP